MACSNNCQPKKFSAEQIGFPQDERLPHFPRSFVLVPRHKLTAWYVPHKSYKERKYIFWRTDQGAGEVEKWIPFPGGQDRARPARRRRSRSIFWC